MPHPTCPAIRFDSGMRIRRRHDPRPVDARAPKDFEPVEPRDHDLLDRDPPVPSARCEKTRWPDEAREHAILVLRTYAQRSGRGPGRVTPVRVNTNARSPVCAREQGPSVAPGCHCPLTRPNHPRQFRNTDPTQSWITARGQSGDSEALKQTQAVRDRVRRSRIGGPDRMSQLTSRSSGPVSRPDLGPEPQQTRSRNALLHVRPSARVKQLRQYDAPRSRTG